MTCSPRYLMLSLLVDIEEIERRINSLLMGSMASGYFPTPMHIMTIVLEDRRFLNHCGIDWKSVVREILKMLVGRKYGGASTIDMQLVRTLTGYRQRSFRRKIYEMALAGLLNRRFSKREILNAYLEIAYFGYRMRGADEVARRHFGEDCYAWLSIEQAAQVASMLVYPEPIEPTERWTNRIQIRSKYGLREFAKLKEALSNIESR